MAWTAPMTAVAGVVWTSAQFNANVRDNLLQTMPGKATAANRIYVTTANNTISERVPSTVQIATSQTTTSTTYANLATTGPQVATVATGKTALVWFMAQMSHSSSSGETSVSVAISGATTLAANDDWRLLQSGVTAANDNRHGVTHLFTGLTAGNNTFTMQYRTNTGTATFSNRDLIVIPL